MERREALNKLAKWSTPAIAMVVLPVHGMTTDVTDTGEPPSIPPPTTPAPPPTTPEPPPTTPEPPPGECEDKDHKSLICHHPDKDGPGPIQYTRKPRDPIEICVANSSVDKHIKNHGDYLGKCRG